MMGICYKLPTQKSFVSTGIHRYNTDHIWSKYFVFSESVYLQNNAVPYWGKGAKFGIETTYTVPEIVFRNNWLASRNLWNKKLSEGKKWIALHCMFLAYVVDVSNNMTCLWIGLLICMPVYYCVSHTRNDIFQLKTLRAPSGQTFCKIMTIGRLSSQKFTFAGNEISFLVCSWTFFYHYTMHFDIYKVHSPELFLSLYHAFWYL